MHGQKNIKLWNILFGVLARLEKSNFLRWETLLFSFNAAGCAYEAFELI